VFTAFAVGQFFSLLLKKEVLAGVLAGLFSVVLTAWSLLMFSWRLDPLWFVLPLGLGAMLATWLWMPVWMVGKSLLRTWPKLAVPVLVALVMISTTLPTARLDQLKEVDDLKLQFLIEPLEVSVQKFNESEPEALETALRYEQLYYKYREELLAIREEDALNESTERRDAIVQRTLEELDEVSRRPVARFSLYQSDSHVATLYLLAWTEAQRLTQEGNLSDAFERYLTAVRVYRHRLQQQPSQVVRENQTILHRKYQIPAMEHIAEGIRDWAQHEAQTSDQLRGAITDLQRVFADFPSPRDAILADRELIREIVLGEMPPGYLESERTSASRYLALLLNMLSWEQRRGIVAVNALAALQLNNADAVASAIDSSAIRTLLRYLPYRTPIFVNDTFFGGDRDSLQKAARVSVEILSSALVVQAFYDARIFGLFQGWVNEITRQRALLVELALLAYRLDHGEYPERLDQLVGVYLEKLPPDPFSGQNFHYRPQGLDYDLDWGHHREKWIPKGTPLLWSVGIRDSQLTGPTLRKIRDDVTVEGGWVPDQDGVEREAFYFTELELGGRGWSQNLVFVLPK